MNDTMSRSVQKRLAAQTGTATWTKGMDWKGEEAAALADRRRRRQREAVMAVARGLRRLGEVL